MNEFDPDKPDGGSLNTGQLELMSCPRCQFEQPVDRYCAKCGIDMTKVAPPRSRNSNRAGLIALIGIILVAGAVMAVRGLRSARPVSTTAPQTANSFESVPSSAPVSARPKSAATEKAAPAPSPRPENAANAFADGEAGPETGDAATDQAASNETESRANEAAPSPAATASPSATPAVGGAIAGGAVGGAVGGATTAASDSAAKKSAAPTEVVVAFAWAEASREWLRAMGAAEPGLHPVSDLEGKLRLSNEGYRVLDITRQRLTSGSTPVQLLRGDRHMLRFEFASATENQLSGSIYPTYRAVDGTTNRLQTLPVLVDKNSGSIYTFPSPPLAALPPGVSPPPVPPEIVVLILPRWSAERNP